MALLIVKIEDAATLAMNEFFDYAGSCYAVTRSRFSNSDTCIDLEDFYEGTARQDELGPVTVVFVQEDSEGFVVLGWYKEATVYKKIRRPSLFLEGNVIADARKVCLLPEDMRQYLLSCHFAGRFYEVIEADDARYADLSGYLEIYHGRNIFMSYAGAPVTEGVLFKELKRNYDKCIDYCMRLAEKCMTDTCKHIGEIKTLETYANQATILNSKKADGFYYLAMAQHQLGQPKKGMKAIEKALKLEPDASDLKVMKGNLLISMGYYEAAAALYHEAWMEDGDEDYMILEGRAWMFKGQMDKAFEVLKKVNNKQALSDAGINLKDMEKRWPFISARGFSLKNFFGKGR